MNSLLSARHACFAALAGYPDEPVKKQSAWVIAQALSEVLPGLTSSRA
ncbi:MAG: hypothetical protein J0J02_09235 [Thiobacillus sp.]|nr:hypothetical protein [Thiobacillus sp.]